MYKTLFVWHFSGRHSDVILTPTRTVIPTHHHRVTHTHLVIHTHRPDAIPTLHQPHVTRTHRAVIP